MPSGLRVFALAILAFLSLGLASQAQAETRKDLEASCFNSSNGEACFNLAQTYVDDHNRTFGRESGQILLHYAPDSKALFANFMACKFGYQYDACNNAADAVLGGEISYDPSVGMMLLQRDCELSGDKACTRLANRLRDAQKGCANPKGAERMYHQCGRLGEFYMTGVLVPRDFAKARASFEGACPQFRAACMAVAEFLSAGVGGPADPARAMALMRAACEARKPVSACSRAANMVKAARPGRPGELEALNLASLGCSNSDGESCLFLARATAAGWGFQKSMDAAETFAVEACFNNSAEGCDLRLSKQFNTGVPLDPDWRRTIAQRGCLLDWTKRVCRK